MIKDPLEVVEAVFTPNSEFRNAFIRNAYRLVSLRASIAYVASVAERSGRERE